jgi:hypothetical protein
MRVLRSRRILCGGDVTLNSPEKPQYTLVELSGLAEPVRPWWFPRTGKPTPSSDAEATARTSRLDQRNAARFSVAHWSIAIGLRPRMRSMLSVMFPSRPSRIARHSDT